MWQRILSVKLGYNMRSLEDIIEAVKNNDNTTHEELKYSVLALNSLLFFETKAVFSLAKAARENKKPILVYSADYQEKESFNRRKRCKLKNPKEWLGWNNDPENPDYRRRI